MVNDSTLYKLRDLAPLAEAKGYSSLSSPQWDRREAVGDWRNYVPEGLRNVWDSLSDEARLSAFIVAEAMTSREQWD